MYGLPFHCFLTPLPYISALLLKGKVWYYRHSSAPSNMPFECRTSRHRKWNLPPCYSSYCWPISTFNQERSSPKEQGDRILLRFRFCKALFVTHSMVTIFYPSCLEYATPGAPRTDNSYNCLYWFWKYCFFQPGGLSKTIFPILLYGHYNHKFNSN